MCDSYFPPTPDYSDDDHSTDFRPSRVTRHRDLQAKTMAANGHITNGIAGSIFSGKGGSDNAHRALSPNRAGAPSKFTLSLGHLPSKKDVKGTYPRTPSRVSSFMSLAVLL